MRKLIQQYAKDLTSGRLGSGYEHSSRVYHLAREIAEDVAHDEDILHAACFLHDIEMTAGHPKSSADRAEAILHETGFDPEKIPVVMDAILNHMPTGNPTTVEGKLLFDANLLDSIGAVGFARLSVGGFIWYNMKTMQEILQFVSRELSFTEKLHFDKSRQMAQEKVDFTKTAIDRLAKELNL
jgi:HD superfamily phosphodiesterase